MMVLFSIFFFVLVVYCACQGLNEGLVFNQIEGKPLVIDCFMFNGEPITFQRMFYLNDVVDIFIVVEMKETFSGIPKAEFYLDLFREEFSYFEKQGKLWKIYVESFPNFDEYAAPLPDLIQHFSHRNFLEKNFRKHQGLLPWARERYLRDYPRDLILNRFPTEKFILMVGDVDEIPRKYILKTLVNQYSTYEKYLSDGLLTFQLQNYYYDFGWMIVNDTSINMIVTNRDGLIKIPSLTNERWSTSNQLIAIENAGWHCSFCSSRDSIKEKLESFAHQEYNEDQYKDLTWIESSQTKGEDLFRRESFNLKRIACNLEDLPIISLHESNLPKQVLEYQNQFVINCIPQDQ